MAIVNALVTHDTIWEKNRKSYNVKGVFLHSFTIKHIY